MIAMQGHCPGDPLGSCACMREQGNRSREEMFSQRRGEWKVGVARLPPPAPTPVGGASSRRTPVFGRDSGASRRGAAPTPSPCLRVRRVPGVSPDTGGMPARRQGRITDAFDIAISPCACGRESFACSRDRGEICGLAVISPRVVHPKGRASRQACSSARKGGCALPVRPECETPAGRSRLASAARGTAETE